MTRNVARFLLRTRKERRPQFLQGVRSGPRGIWLRVCSRTASGSAAVISVSMYPGATAFTVMLRLASSRARLLVRPMSPAFAAGVVHLARVAHHARHGRDVHDAAGTAGAAWPGRRPGQPVDGLKFVSRTSSQSSCFMRSSRPSRVMPALLTRMSMRPRASTEPGDEFLRLLRRRQVGADADVGAVLHRRQGCRGFLRLAASRPHRATRAPSAAKRWAMAHPRPRVPPVMIALFEAVSYYTILFQPRKEFFQALPDRPPSGMARPDQCG